MRRPTKGAEAEKPLPHGGITPEMLNTLFK